MAEEEAVNGILVINLSSHPLTNKQRTQLQRMERSYIIEEIDIPVHFDPTRDVESQIESLVQKIDLQMEEWSGASLYIVLPGLAPCAAAILAYFHGLRGGFPKVIWVYQSPTDSTSYEVTQIINLQELRDKARKRRSESIT